MDITIKRGDTNKITFKIKTTDDSSYVMQENDKLYFTVKKDCFKEECVLQKTFNKGIEYDAATELYSINLDQDCTCDLCYGVYVYDIELIINEPRIVKTLECGNFIIDKEVTCKRNEV